MTIKPDSVDTNNAKRDGHLKSPDFFNTKQYPTIEFVSTSVKPAEGGYQVTGNLTFHGETKPVTFDLKGGKTTEFKGVQRTGYTTQFKIKRSEFGVAKKVPGDARRGRLGGHQLRGDQEVSGQDPGDRRGTGFTGS